MLRSKIFLPFLCKLKTRSIILINGKDAPKFLQGLISSDIREILPIESKCRKEIKGGYSSSNFSLNCFYHSKIFQTSSALSSLFLSAKGRALAHIYIFNITPNKLNDSPEFLLECNENLAPSVEKLLRNRKLNSDVEIRDVSSELLPYQLLPPLNSTQFPSSLKQKESTKTYLNIPTPLSECIPSVVVTSNYEENVKSIIKKEEEFASCTSDAFLLNNNNNEDKKLRRSTFYDCPWFVKWTELCNNEKESGKLFYSPSLLYSTFFHRRILNFCGESDFYASPFDSLSSLSVNSSCSFRPASTRSDGLLCLDEYIRKVKDKGTEENYFKSIIDRKVEKGADKLTCMKESIAMNPYNILRRTNNTVLGFIGRDARYWKLGYKIYIHKDMENIIDSLTFKTEEDLDSLSKILCINDSCSSSFSSSSSASSSLLFQPVCSPSTPSLSHSPEKAQEEKVNQIMKQKCTNTLENKDFEDLYDWLRILYCIPEKLEEIPSNNILPIYFNFDFIGSLSDSKGCYVGQELTNRTLNLLPIRKRLVLCILNPKESSYEKILNEWEMKIPISSNDVLSLWYMFALSKYNQRAFEASHNAASGIPFLLDSSSPSSSLSFSHSPSKYILVAKENDLLASKNVDCHKEERITESKNEAKQKLMKMGDIVCFKFNVAISLFTFKLHQESIKSAEDYLNAIEKLKNVDFFIVKKEEFEKMDLKTGFNFSEKFRVQIRPALYAIDA